MESCSNSKVLEEFSCRHSKRRCFTKNNQKNIKKTFQKNSKNKSTTVLLLHTQTKKNINKKKHVLPSFYPHPYPSTPFNPPPTQPLFNQPPRPPRSLQVENCWNHRCRWESGGKLGEAGGLWEECWFPVDDTVHGR